MIGYYVHHHGAGHLQRARAITAHLPGRATLLGSIDPDVLSVDGAGVAVVELARDDDPRPPAGADVTADGALHWAPLRHEGLRDRHARLASWLVEARAELLVSDVSMEAVLLARLLSVPPVVVAQRGVRVDRPHVSGYDAAVAVVAPWTQALQHDVPARWLAKTVWVGLVSRFDGRPREHVPCGGDGTCVVLVLGRGGTSMQARDLAELAAVGGVHWHLLGAVPQLPPGLDAGRLDVRGVVDDPWPWLCSADVVVSAAGGSSVADVAAARASLVAVAQPRPFDEQAHHVGLLVEHGLCVGVDAWPDRAAWPSVLERAAAVGGDGWAEHSDGDGARRAAAALVDLAGRDWTDRA